MNAYEKNRSNFMWPNGYDDDYTRTGGRERRRLCVGKRHKQVLSSDGYAVTELR